MAIDRLSFLPQHIRDKIICLLPLKEAVRASTLSRDWRSVYSSLSNFEINYRQLLEGNSTGVREIVSCLLLRHDKSDIQVFKLSVDVDDTTSTHNHVNGWISFAIYHNVKELYIEFFDRLAWPVYLPCCPFTCNSLIELTLVGITLALPTIIALPALKRLTLTHIYMKGCALAENFFPNCPVLEFLSMEGVKFRQINVCAPNLQQIIYVGSMPPKITLETLSSLRNVDFSFTKEIVEVAFCDHANGIWMGLQNVEKLHLRNKSYVEYLSRVPVLNACCSLKDLFLHMPSAKIHIQVLALLTKSYPYLETLSILVEKQMTSTDSSTTERDWQLRDLSAASTMKHLSTVKTCSFEGSEIELELVRFILQNDKVLRKMYITYSNDVMKNVEACLRISRELLKFTRASPHVSS